MKQLDYTRKELNIGKVFIITFMVALLITALTGCAITYETPKCVYQTIDVAILHNLITIKHIQIGIGGIGIDQ